ncbi:hypothetical protein CK203_095056 [Vitis vinifera]|uniref:G-patch domain-containing protein n=1 Tax=Vitis vinifera TaxID=29760 RepID=A0A438C6Z6_VITVI|nr:hypothetical protein CK203_095056 [Vitis vinifera]
MMGLRGHYGTLTAHVMIGPVKYSVLFQVLRIQSSFNLLLRYGAMSFDQYSSTLVLNMMRSMSYLPGLGLGRHQHGPREFTFTVDHDIPYGLGYTPMEEDARYMARLQGQNHAPHMEGIVCISEAVEVQDLQRPWADAFGYRDP